LALSSAAQFDVGASVQLLFLPLGRGLAHALDDTAPERALGPAHGLVFAGLLNLDRNGSGHWNVSRDRFARNKESDDSQE
jgi:hypothetical protein